MKRKLGEIPHLHNPSTPETVFFGGGVKIDRVEARVSWSILLELSDSWSYPDSWMVFHGKIQSMNDQWGTP